MITSTESIRDRRKKLGITQKDFALKLGISNCYLNQIENNGREPSTALLEQMNHYFNRDPTEPELNLIFDYVRIRFPTDNVDRLITEILHLHKEYMLEEDWGFYGYSSQLVFSHIQILCSMPNSELGTLLELKGQGCREFESILLANNLTWYDFFRDCQKYQAVFKRIDLAINDTAGILSIPELIKKCERNECISIMRQFESTNSAKMNTEDEKFIKGNTLYIGSKSSDIYFCIYEKDVEQYKKVGAAIETAPIKNRFEIRLKNERAFKAIEDLLIYRDVEKTAFGIITRYLQFVDTKKNIERNKWPINQRWAYFCGQNRQPLRLTVAPEPFDLQKTKAWIQKQVAPMLKVLLKIDGYNGTTDTMTMIKNTKLQKRHLKLLAQQTTGIDELLHNS